MSHTRAADIERTFPLPHRTLYEDGDGLVRFDGRPVLIGPGGSLGGKGQ